MNEQCDSGAKLAINDVDPNAGMAAQPLPPLEPICVYVDRGKEKMTSDTFERVRFHGIARWLGRSSLRDRSYYHPRLHKWIGLM